MKRSLGAVGAALGICLLSASASAAVYTWVGANGDWSDSTMWDKDGGGTGLGVPGVGDTAVVAARPTITLTGDTQVDTLTISPGNASGGAIIQGAFTLTANTLTNDADGTYGSALSCIVGGSGTIDVYGHNEGYQRGGLNLTNTANTFNGTLNFHPQDATYAGGWSENVRSLGTGFTMNLLGANVLVRSQFNSLDGTINIQTGSRFQTEGNYPHSLAGNVNIDGEGLFTLNIQTLTISATIANSSAPGASPGKFIWDGFSSDHWYGTADLTVVNSYTAGTEIRGGTLKVSAAGALSNGAVAMSGGRLLTSATNSLMSAAGVVNATGGKVELGSVEGQLALTIAQGAGFGVNVAGNSIVYTPVIGNVQVAAGCVISDNANTPKPTLAQLGAGDGLTGYYLETTGSYTVGTASGTPYRGIGTAYGNTTYSGTLDEAATSTEGVQLYSGYNAQLTLSGATINSAGSNPIELRGPGDFVLSGSANAFNNAVNMLGGGRLGVSAANGASGMTLNVSNGYLDLDNVNSLNGGTANIKTGGIFRVDVTPASGNINVVGGGGVYSDSLAYLAGAATWDWSAADGAQFGSSGGDTITSLPGPGVTSYLMRHGNMDALRTINVDIVLAHNTRGMNLPEPTGAPIRARWGGTGVIRLDTSETEATLAAQTGMTFEVNNQIDFGTGKLIIGDATGQFAALTRAGQNGFVTVATAGNVRIYNDNNLFGSVDVRSGTLIVDANLGELGGANLAAVNVASNAVLQLDLDNPSMNAGVAFTGSGKVRVGNNNSGTSRMLLTGGSIDPGNSAGVLTVEGNLRFALNGADPVALTIEVLGDGQVAGTDYDRLDVSLVADQLANAKLIVTGSGSFTTTDLAILTAGTLNAGEVFGAVEWAPNVTGTVVYDYGNNRVLLTDVTVTPEPATVGLLGLGLLPLLRRRRRR